MRPVFEVLKAAEAAHESAVHAQQEAVYAVQAYKSVLNELAESLGFAVRHREPDVMSGDHVFTGHLPSGPHPELPSFTEHDQRI
jgi:hypothetical protein